MPLQHHVHRPWNTTAGIWTTSYRTCTHVPLRSAQIPWVLTLSPYPGVSTSGLPSAHAQSATTRLDALAPDNVERDVPPVDWADGDVLRLHLDDGEHVYAEALAGAPSRTKAARQLSRSIGTPGAAPSGSQILCGGVRYIVRTGATKTTQAGAAAAPLESAGDVGPVMVLEAAGGALAASEPLRDLLAVPPKKHAPALRSWAPLTARLVKPTAPRQQHQHQQLQATYSGSLHGVHVVRADRVMTLGELRRRAATEPGAWCDGSGPSDGPLSDDARAVFTAGEVAALMEGRRGVVLLQLHVGWDEHEKVPPYGPYKPLVLRLLREALERPDILSYASNAPVPGAAVGNPTYGLTVILCADKEPFRSWGAHLASFGCQAALEAQSPYYKSLIGRILGYRPENISHYVQEKHGHPPSSEVVAAVEQQLLQLSPKPAVLPWNTSSRGGGRKKARRYLRRSVPDCARVVL